MRFSIRRFAPPLLAVCGSALAPCWDSPAQTRAAPLDVARYTAEGRLAFPADTDRWVFLGANIGGDYTDAAFDPSNPGRIGVVQMEPRAFAHLVEHGEFADGTMLLLSFYDTQEKPEPELNGFVQGDLTAREIHVIDRQRFADGRAFFLFPAGSTAPSDMLPAGNECVRCHTEHGRFDGTFAQFYPVVRERLGIGAR
ncbi:MAG TPA: cytochrome P460 family protein [Gammaproteobacteria bacterium]